MVAAIPGGLRRSLAAVLIVALAFAGVGRALAAVPVPSGDVVAGVYVPICHHGAGEAPGDPSRPGDHDCCDACALLALAVLPSPPALTRPGPVESYSAPTPPARWSPLLARPRSPRLSRGPPAA